MERQNECNGTKYNESGHWKCILVIEFSMLGYYHFESHTIFTQVGQVKRGNSLDFFVLFLCELKRKRRRDKTFQQKMFIFCPFASNLSTMLNIFVAKGEFFEITGKQKS